MNKVVLEGLTFRIDKHCPTTVGNVQKLSKQRSRHASYAFRKMFSQTALEGKLCASDACGNKLRVRV